MISPIYEDGSIVEVGHKIARGSATLEIIRVDSATQQVWYKQGGFDWFESMKKYRGLRND